VPKPPRIIRAIQRNAHWFSAANEVLAVLFAARGGGPVSKGLAVMSAFGTALDNFFPGESAWDIMRQRGYKDTDYSIGGFLCDTLLRSDLDRVVMVVGLGTQIVFWETERGGIAAVYNGTQYSDGPYLMDGDEDYFIERLREVVWSQGNDLMLSAKRGTDRYSWRGAGKFRLTPMLPPGPYIGKRRPEDIAARLARYGDVARTVLLRGPTGIGKSVMARHVAGLLGKEGNRTLKIAASILKSCRFDEVTAFVRFFQPTVLLLDDLDLDDDSNTEEFLTMLEALRAPDCLVIVTMMTPTEPDKEPTIGDWHFAGMRPGRIDETFTFYLPDPRERADILRLYFQEFQVAEPAKRTMNAIVKATDKLPGAYLMEVARRIAVHGIKDWKAEIQNVRRTAPANGSDDDDEDDVEIPEELLERIGKLIKKGMDPDKAAAKAVAEHKKAKKKAKKDDGKCEEATPSLS